MRGLKKAKCSRSKQRIRPKEKYILTYWASSATLEIRTVASFGKPFFKREISLSKLKKGIEKNVDEDRIGDLLVWRAVNQNQGLCMNVIGNLHDEDCYI